MTHQDEGRIEVTKYEDDIVVRGPSHVVSGLREMIYQRFYHEYFFEYACAVMVIIVTIIRICLIVVVMERPR